jgi:hypothetical protein
MMECLNYRRIVPQVIKRLPTYYRTPVIITVFTSHWDLS